jgi:YaiO family outer membrane protein
LLSLGYGEEGWRWIFLKFSLGDQAYQALNLAEPEDVRQDAWEITLFHRHWLGRDWGLKEQVGFLSLEDGYDKYAVSVGFFKEF